MPPDPTDFARLVHGMEFLCVGLVEPSDSRLFHYHNCSAVTEAQEFLVLSQLPTKRAW